MYGQIRQRRVVFYDESPVISCKRVVQWLLFGIFDLNGCPSHGCIVGIVEDDATQFYRLAIKVRQTAKNQYAYDERLFQYDVFIANRALYNRRSVPLPG